MKFRKNSEISRTPNYGEAKILESILKWSVENPARSRKMTTQKSREKHLKNMQTNFEKITKDRKILKKDLEEYRKIFHKNPDRFCKKYGNIPKNKARVAQKKSRKVSKVPKQQLKHKQSRKVLSKSTEEV